MIRWLAPLCTAVTLSLAPPAWAQDEGGGDTAATPETAAPETAAPETAAPETAAPETAAPETTAPETAAAPAAAAPDGRRPLPDYDGRGEEPVSVGETALWIPRVILAPVYVVTEYGIHRPVGAVTTWMEKEKVFSKVTEALTFGRSNEFFFVPVVIVDTELRLTVGGYFTVADFVGEDAKLSLFGTYAGERGWELKLTERLPLGHSDGWKDELKIDLFHDQRPDHPFYGIGEDTRTERVRYFRSETTARMRGTQHFGVLDVFDYQLEVGRNTFGEGGTVRSLVEPPIEDEFDVDAIPGFDGYTLAAGSFGIALDSRQPRPAGGSGARLELKARVGTDLDGNQGFVFARYGAELALFLDLDGHNRVLGIAPGVEIADAVDGEVPFTELAVLGGNETMRGFAKGRFRGESAFVVPIQYTWPIAVSTDGLLFWEMGGVFGPEFDGFGFDRLHASFGLGARARFQRDSALDLLVGWGTNRFDEGTLEIEEFRFTLAATRGF